MKNEFLKRLKYKVDTLSRKNKKITEIEQCKEFGINLIGKKNANEIIDKIVEEPLRKTCKDLRNKGIETVMSSANKNGPSFAYGFGKNEDEKSGIEVEINLEGLSKRRKYV